MVRLGGAVVIMVMGRGGQGCPNDATVPGTAIAGIMTGAGEDDDDTLKARFIRSATGSLLCWSRFLLFLSGEGCRGEDDTGS